MNSSRLLLAFILLASPCDIYSQDHPDYSSILKGVWISAESLQPAEIEPFTTSNYTKYSFDGEGGVFIATNQFERGEHVPCKVTTNILDINGYLFTILRYENDELELEHQSLVGKIITRRIFVRKQKYDRIWKFTDASGIAVNTPIFKGNFHLWEYMFSKYETPKDYEANLALRLYEPEPVLPKDDIFIRAEVVVDSSGSIRVNKLSSAEMNSKKLQGVKEKLENTSGYWIPGDVGGEYKTQTINLIFVKRGRTSTNIRLRAMTLFRKAYALYEKEDFRGAVMSSSEAITLDQSRFQFYLFRAACYLQLEDVDKYCSDMSRANTLNPFVSLENIEVVKGEAVKITCSAGGK